MLFNLQFYKETKFKDIPELRIKIPEDWELVKLKDIVKKVKGKKPKEMFEEKSENTLPYLTAQVLRGVEFPQYSTMQNVIMVEPDDVVIIWDGSYAGDVFLIKEKGVLASTMVKLILTNDKINKLYLYCWLLNFGEILKTMRKGGEIPHVDDEVFNNFLVGIPNLEEQKAIAEILSTIDKAIEKVRDDIEKTEKLKKSLIQKLLTGEIRIKEENGKLKFYKETKFKDIPELRIKIPEDWEVVELKDICIKIKDIDHKMPQKVERGISFISIKYMLKYEDYNFYINRNDPDLEYITKDDFEYHRKRFNVEKGDILYSRFGSIGFSKYVNTDEPFIASYSIVLIKSDRNKVFSLYLLYALNSEKTRQQALLATKGAANKNLHLKDIEALKILLPSLEEQKLISEVLSTIDKKIEQLKKKKELLEKIKKWLMNKLLTGETRVKIYG